MYRSGGALEPLPSSRHDFVFTAAAGDPDDLAVFVAHTPSGSPALLGMAGRRWMRPYTLPGVAAITDLTRISETHWLVCGAQENGQGFACLYEPLMWEHSSLVSTPEPLVACAAQAKDQAVAVGLKGSAVRVVDGYLTFAPASHPVDLWSVDIDGVGNAWAGAAGSLWQQVAPGQPWEQAFATPLTAGAPFTSLFADVGRIVGMTRAGGRHRRPQSPSVGLKPSCRKESRARGISTWWLTSGAFGAATPISRAAGSNRWTAVIRRLFSPQIPATVRPRAP